MARHFYLVAYDVRCPHRLRHTLKAVKAFRTSGQKSVAECFLSASERESLLRTLGGILAKQDRLHCLRLDPRMGARLFGVAQAFRPGPFIIS